MEIKFIKDRVTLVYDGEELVAFFRQNGSMQWYKTEKLTAAGLDEIVGADKPPKA